MELPRPTVLPPLAPGFRPAALASRSIREEEPAVPVAIAVEREDGLVSVHRTRVPERTMDDEASFRHVERTVKFLLWARGGWRVVFGGPENLGRNLQQTYSPSGARAFDAGFMGELYGKPFCVEVTSLDAVPEPNERPFPAGRHLNGCRIGFDAGASDHKVAAVVDGQTVFSEEIVWNPKSQADPEYHYSHIKAALRKAAAHLPRVDGVGVSSAGIYINNRAMVASLFRGIPKDVFRERIPDIYINCAKELGDIPVTVLNDGDVTAIAGAMALEDTAVLGVAMGSSEAGGYVDRDGNITGWLNELAFCPIDYAPDAPTDEWSGDSGCGVDYLSQVGCIRLAAAGGLSLDEGATPAEKLEVLQALHSEGHPTAVAVFESIGVYLGYAIAHYAEFYDIRHLLVLGRVTSGRGGQVILEQARRVLAADFPELAGSIQLHLPDESSRRVGQAVAAASLPVVA